MPKAAQLGAACDPQVTSRLRRTAFCVKPPGDAKIPGGHLTPPGRRSTHLGDLDALDTGIEALGESSSGMPRGVAGLWISVITLAWQDRRYDFFLSTGTYFEMACDCAGISVSAVRARVKRKKGETGC